MDKNTTKIIEMFRLEIVLAKMEKRKNTKVVEIKLLIFQFHECLSYYDTETMIRKCTLYCLYYVISEFVCASSDL